MDKPRLFVDMDGTLAEWRNVKINVENVEDCYREEYFEKMLDKVLYSPHYFGTLKPHIQVVNAIKKLIAEGEIEVYILSCVMPDKYDQSPVKDKNDWLDKFLPEVDKDHRIFVPNGKEKKDYIPGGVKITDALLDDYTKNLTSFARVAKAIKLSNGINSRNGTWLGNRISYTDMFYEIADDLKNIVVNDKNIIKEDPIKDLEVIDAEDYLKQFEDEEKGD